VYDGDGSNTLKYALGEDPGSIKISLPTEVGSTASGTFDGYRKAMDRLRSSVSFESL
jgi:hypothetical protein